MAGGGGLREIVAKLGNRDEAVRVRALKSLLFKLSSGLATQDQLWQVDISAASGCNPRAKMPLPTCSARLRQSGPDVACFLRRRAGRG